MRKIFIALCTMVSVITGNAQNTPIGENIELAGENPEELKVNPPPGSVGWLAENRKGWSASGQGRREFRRR